LVPRTPQLTATEAGEIRQDVLRLFNELGDALTDAERGGAGECHPSVDVVETPSAIEVLVDVAGVQPKALRLLVRDGILVIVGEKAPRAVSTRGTFHLVEREFGRFARAIRLTGALDVSSARARIADGELHIVLPKLEERRGRAHMIPILSPVENPT
jgi:HSP20 family protein